MMRQDDWTGRWVANKILEHDNVIGAELLDNRMVRITRKKYPDVVIATTAVERFDDVTLRKVVTDPSAVNFVVNMTRDHYITGEAIKLASAYHTPIGGMSDLFRALNEPDVSSYVNPEIIFIERSLRQHNRVTEFERLWDRKYRIDRLGLPSVDVVFLNDYELTADHIRKAWDRYGPFSMVVKTNPNGKATTTAHQVADELGCKIYEEWRNFLGALNRK